jgi:hypothetical protein
MKLGPLPTWAGCLVLCLSAHPAVAQVAFTLDGTGTRVAYSEGPGTTAWALTPGFQLLRPWQSLSGSGTYAQFPDGTWSLRGQTMGSAFTPPLLRFRGELGGSASATLYQDLSQSGQYLGTIRLHWIGSRAGAWVGGTMGNAWNGMAWRGTRKSEVGAWVRRGRAALSMTVSPTAIGDSLRYSDLESGLQVTAGSMELGASGGLRFWSRPSGASSSAWGMASATYWLGRNIAIVASAGTYPADYGQGLPQGTYGSVGLRLASRRPGTALPKTGAQLLAPDRTRRGTTTVEARRRTVDSVILTVIAADAGTVEVMGDFTGWSPVTLTRVRADRWVVALPIPTGSHRMNVRIDGGTWGVPAGVPSLSDEFSGVVGLLVIE